MDESSIEEEAFLLERYPSERVWFSTPSSLPGLEIMHARRSPRLWKVWHEKYTLAFCYCCPWGSRQGGAEWEYRGRQLRMAPGEVMLMEPGGCHVTRRLLGFSDFDVLEIDSALVTEVATEQGYATPVHLREAWSEDPGLFRAAEILAMGVYLRHDAVLQQARLVALLTLVLSRCAEHEAKRMAALDKVQLRRARDFIHAHYSDDFDLTALASAAGASKSAICHGLRATVGVPPLELRSLVRAAQARRMLASGIAASEVAAAAGYCDQAQLTRHFRALWGITPARYARTLQSKYP